MTMGCRRVEAVIEEQLDDFLDESGRAALDEHLALCEECRNYRHAARRTREMLVSVPLVEPTSRSVSRMWEQLAPRLEAESAAAARPMSSPWRWAGLAVASVAAIAIVVTVVATRSDGGSEPLSSSQLASFESSHISPFATPVITASPEVVAVPRFVLESGSARRGGAADTMEPGDVLEPGDTLRVGETVAILVSRDQVRFALSPGSEAELVRFESEHLSLELDSGWLVGQIDPGETDLHVEVTTSVGAVRVTGTIFAVEALSDAIEVRVLRGAVEVDFDGASTRIEADRGVLFETEAIHAPDELTASWRMRDEALLVGRATSRPRRPLDDLDTLFERAEGARRSSEYSRAAGLYQRISSRDPSGGAGGTALISLGQIALGPLSQPSRALRAFRRYLDSRRQPLRQEAYVGAYRAEGALGRTAAARRTAQRYRDEFPAGRYRRVLSIE